MYKTILADPPWPYNDRKGPTGTGGRGRVQNVLELTQVGVGQHYDTMTLEDIKNLGVGEISENESHLYLWTTNSFMVEAHEVARAWGFEPKTIVTWVKVKADGSPSMKTGWYFRSATEHIIFATKGNKRLHGPPHPTAFFTPRTRHSRKPDYQYEMIEAQSEGPYLELFARPPHREGWDVWGDEAEGGSEAAVEAVLQELVEGADGQGLLGS